MKVTVKLFGTLQPLFPGYDAGVGLEAMLPDGSTVKDLIDHLRLPAVKAPVVSCQGRILKPADSLANGKEVQIFQPIAGG